MTDEEKLITICDDRFEIISKAKKHIIEATNIEMSSKEMEVLDNFLFRCWQMGWLKNDYKALEIENAELKEQIERLEEDNLNKQELINDYVFENAKLTKENAKLNRDKTELVNSVTELKTKVTELEEKPKNNSYVQILQNEKAEMAEDFAKQIENLKMVTSSWIMSLMDVRESKVNNRRGEVLKEIERRMEKLAK